MKRQLTVLFLLVNIISFASGDWGSYRIQGSVKQKGKLLINESINVKIGFKDTIIKTDSLGFYSVTISWSTFHAIGQSYKSAIKKNPKYIYITYKKSIKKVKNEWQNSRQYLLHKTTKKNVIPIKYDIGKEPMMFGEVDVFTTPNVYVVKNLNFRR